MQTLLRLGFLAWLSWATLALASDSDSSPDTSPVASYIDTHTVAVVRIDLQRAEIAVAEQQLQQAFKLSPRYSERLSDTVRELDQVRRQLLDAAAKEVYILVGTDDYPKANPMVVVPRAAADAEKVGQALRKLPAYFGDPGRRETRIREDAVVRGTAEKLERLEHADRCNCPALAAAMSAAQPAAVQLFVVPSAEQRRILAEMLPGMSPELGGGSGRTISEGLKWAVVQLQLQPSLQLRAVVQSESSEAAQELQQMVARLLESQLQTPQVREAVPQPDQLVQSLTPKREEEQLTVTLNDAGDAVQQFFAALSAPLEKELTRIERLQSSNNLKTLALAMHNFHDVNKRFPAAAIYDDQGRPLLSWRVQLLPYLDAEELYEQFHLDQPWDSPHNRQLIEKMPQVFANPSMNVSKAGKTAYLAPTGPHTIFQGKEGLRFRDITDGTSQTVMVVEATADQAVVWTKPEDLEINPEQPRRGLLTPEREGFAAVFADGAMHFLPDSIEDETLRRLIDPQDGKPVNYPSQ